MSWIRIIYKNGAVIDCKSPGVFLTRGRLEGDLRSITWSPGTSPRPLFAGLSEIAAIWDYGDTKPP